ncbi:hypothetical protein INS49_014439 [Diaporthe citri]|uniref:uncharacterized protein n=1 Tax=Diaporthe citri TaxID=83186 RepID=UPI001C818ECD|nr:uncharacterized protein INS49_014439 [Diaporthe citri]KAG6356566.1 hypothetical protein INS49_014439 [Diaporthe citri]
MAPSKPNDVEAFGAGLAQEIQEKHNLRERNHQAVPDTDRRQRTMDSGRKLLLALLVCCMVALGLASAHQGRADCHEDASNVDSAVANVEHSSLSSLLASNSAESLRELLEKYVPERYRQQDSQIAKRQDSNATVSTAVTTAVTTLSSASTVATTTVQTPTNPTTTAATTPTSESVQTSVQTQTVVQTSVQTQDPATETVTAPQTPTPSDLLLLLRSVSVDSSTTTVTGATQATSRGTTLDTSKATPTVASSTSKTRTPVSSKKVTTTFTSTMPDGGISVVTQTSFSYVDAEPTDGSTTRPAASLQTNAAPIAGPSLPGAATLFAGLWFFLWQ